MSWCSRNSAIFLFLLAVSLIAFGVGLTNPFLFDDTVVIVKNEWLTWGYLPNFFRSFIQDSGMSFPGFRPLVMATFAIQHELSGLNPTHFRFANLILHVTNAFLVFLIVKRFVVRSSDHRSIQFSLLVALFFLLHPVQTNIITLVWKRTDLLVGLGFLGSLYFFSVWNENGGWRHLLFGFLFSLIAFVSKESALILPVALGLFDFYFGSTQKSLRTKLVMVYAPLVALSSIVGWIVFVIMPRTLAAQGYQVQAFSPPSLHLNRVDYLMTQSAALIEYLKLILVPSSLSVFHHLVPIRSLTDPRLWIGVWLVLIFLGLAVILRRRNRLISFSIVWFLLLLAPSSSIVPLYLPFDEDRLYLSMIGVACVSALFFTSVASYAQRHDWKFTSKLAKLSPLLVCLLYISNDVLRLRVWRDDVQLWGTNVRDEPEDPRAWLNLGLALAHAKRLDASVTAITRATRLEPSYGVAHYFLGQSYLEMDRYAEANAAFGMAIRYDAFIHDSLAFLGTIAAKQARPAEAARFFNLALTWPRKDVVLLRDYGLLLEDEDETASSEQALEIAYRMEPSDAETELRLGYLLWKHNTNRPRAIKLVRQSLVRRPSDEQTKKVLALMNHSH